jgi:TolB-like protein/Tfp pilus assembly protein PilF
MAEFLARLKQRKLVQWAIAYLAAAWVCLQVLDLATGSYHWPDAVMHAAFGVAVLGFVVTLVLAWYHGEQGRQRVSGAELLLIALALAVGGGLLWRFTGMQSRTNVASIAASVAPGEPAAAARTSAAPLPSKSIAVLPFVNMSGDPKNDYFSDGITEEILNALAQVPHLKVAARTSAFAFKGKEEDLRKVGEVLDVATVLEGSVQRSGDEVRITAQLIDTRTGYHLWSEKYDRKLTSIFVVEDEISKAIADKLRVQLVGDNRSLVAQADVDPRAHDLYLHGLTLLAGRTSLRDAVASFRKAVAIAPHYAQAWAKLAQTYMLLPWYEHESVETATKSAQAAVDRARALAPDNASAWAALGMINRMRWHWADADAAFRRALQLAPGDAEVINQYAQFLWTAGQFEAAVAAFRRAQALDPLSPAITPGLVDTLLAMHRFAEAAKVAAVAIEAHPDSALNHKEAMTVAAYRHRYADAQAQARQAIALAGDRAGMALIVAPGIETPSQRATAARAIESYAAEKQLDSASEVEWLALLGARDSALDALERFAARRAGVNEGVVWVPALDPVREDPRFTAVLREMGLPYRPTTAGSP